MAEKEYLGDAVYATYDEASDSVVLTTEDGVSRPSNTIILGTQEMIELVKFAKKLEIIP